MKTGILQIIPQQFMEYFDAISTYFINDVTKINVY